MLLVHAQSLGAAFSASSVSVPRDQVKWAVHHMSPSQSPKPQAVGKHYE